MDFLLINGPHLLQAIVRKMWECHEESTTVADHSMRKELISFPRPLHLFLWISAKHYIGRKTWFYIPLLWFCNQTQFIEHSTPFFYLAKFTSQKSKLI